MTEQETQFYLPPTTEQLLEKMSNSLAEISQSLEEIVAIQKAKLNMSEYQQYKIFSEKE